MNIAPKVAAVSLVTLVFSNTMVTRATSTTAQAGAAIPASQCPNPFPTTYKWLPKTKYIKIPALCIAVKAGADARLVYLSPEKRYTLMTPPEYQSYQCSLEKGLSYQKFYPYPYSLSYKAIENPKRLPMEKALTESAKADGDFAGYSAGETAYQKIRIGKTDFITHSSDQERAWFVPRSKPGIVVAYSHLCGCGSEHQDLVEQLKRIKPI
jgi:hypothetical protein